MRIVMCGVDPLMGVGMDGVDPLMSVGIGGVDPLLLCGNRWYGHHYGYGWTPL
jgi:hypothetical protein